MKVEFRDSQGKFQYFEIRKSEAIIGRSRKCDIVLPYESLSRQHARIDILEGDDATVTDLGSANGTFLNDKKIDLNIPESFSSLFSFTLGNGIQMRLMEESEELPNGSEFTVIKDELRRSGSQEKKSYTDTGIRTQMVGARRSRQKQAGTKQAKDKKSFSKKNKGSSNILRAIILILCAVAVYLFLAE